MTKVYIVDSCYLLELFRVPGHFQHGAYEIIKEKFSAAISEQNLLVVPFPCIFELGNHIAHIDDGAARYQLAQQLTKTVKMSLEESVPWIIPPHSGIDKVLNEICKCFSDEYVALNIGLIDTYIIKEAGKWKNKYNSSRYKVHIWTKDEHLKAYEPDHEPNSFLA